MGMGLSVSRSIIEAHDGRMWATANDGPGSTFAFSVPCAHSHAPPPHTAEYVDSTCQQIAPPTTTSRPPLQVWHCPQRYGLCRAAASRPPFHAIE
jgi:hypothetical protein